MILVAYFSHSGNTREVADRIHKIVNGDIFEIRTVKPYPEDYDAVVRQARQELVSGYKPPLAPFCTHGGGGLGNSVGDILKICPRSKLLDGLAIRGGAVKTAQDKVSEWLREIKITG